MSKVKRFLFENRNFTPEYDPDEDHSYDYDAPEGEDQDLYYDEDDLDEDELAEMEGLEEVEPELPTFSQDELEAAKKAAFEQGKAAGIKEAKAQIEHMLATSLAQISGEIPKAFQAHIQNQEGMESDMVSISLAISKKILPTYAMRHSLDEIANLVGECLEALRAEPKIIVKVHSSLKDDISDRLEAIADDLGYDGRLTVVANDKVVPGDCQVNWAEGGAERKTEELWQQIDEIIERNLTQGTDRGQTPDTPA